jgi:hypothetical protein
MLKDKKYFAFVLVHAFLFLLANNSFAQFEIKSFETVHEDSTSQQEREALYFYKNYPSHYFNNDGFNTTKKYAITLFLKDGRVIDTHSQINFSEPKHFLLSDSLKIFPENTEKIIVHFENRDYDFIGIPGDSCWLFRINDNTDQIWLYSFLPEDKRRFIVFAKAKESALQPALISKEFVSDMAKSSDKTVSELIQKGRLIEAIKQYNIRYTIRKIN